MMNRIRLEQEVRHFNRIRSFFDDTVARIIISEMASGDHGDEAIDTELQARGCRRLESGRETCERILEKSFDVLGSGAPVILMTGTPEDGLARVMPSPALDSLNYIILSPEALDLPEGSLAFVLGHEMAHLAYEHHVLRWIVDTVYPPGQAMPPYLANEFDIWKQCAELSADRAGLNICGNLDDAERVLDKLVGRGRPGPSERLTCLRDNDAVQDIYESMLRTPDDGFQLALVNLLRASGEILAASDGRSGGSERAYLINRISRHSYIAPDEAREVARFTTKSDDCRERNDIATAGKVIRELYHHRKEEAFLNLAVVIVRDGRVTEEEYMQLRQIGEEHLGLDIKSIHNLMLRVFRSGYYNPFEE